MKALNLTVNGRGVAAAAVEPRTHLADFLRDELDLTGTHLGCEHGVCGACTLLVDGVPARSCITLAVACNGASVNTIEGMDDDACMRALRAAFSREHALQCGYCTPGMLVSARDVVLRMPDATEAQIRFAMSGNLCRCTGYVGIVKAIQSVLAERKAAGIVGAENPRALLGPVGSGHAAPVPAHARAANDPRPAGRAAEPAARVAGAATMTPAAAAAAVAPSTVNRGPAADSGKPLTTLTQTFTVDYPREQVWAFFGRLGDVTTCLPGASLLAPATETHVEPRLRIKVGPIVAEFEGAADVVRDEARHSGTIYGSARDTRSSSATRGEIRYDLTEEQGGRATRVDVQVGFALTGALAQFSRSSIVKDIAGRMTDAFASNLRARLANDGAQGGDGTPVEAAPVSELNAGSLVFSVLRERIVGFFRALFGR
ncbi:2Fe-2S iron-sulfur cluster-binding protein [Burkholderia anthina]|uniref:xanthine dehydrogenase family Fe-S subunit n=1 Tax=Burkholderia anthina TaxID=179879 RepID=UPI00158A6C4F